MLRDFQKRAVIAALSAGVTAFFVIFAFHSWMQYIVATAIALLTGVAIWEYEQFAKAKGGKMVLPMVIALGFIEVFSFFIAAQSAEWRMLPIAVFFFGLLILFALHFKENEGALVNLSTSSFGLLYVAIPMGMVLAILYGEHWDGRWWVAYALIVTKITDIGAYFGGSFWGKRKLAPTISPAKTIEGAFFGLACAALASFVFYLFGHTVHRGWLILGLILGAVAQFSDLSESLLKRDAKVKDSNALPGIGGALDAIDSLLFTIPIVYFYLHFIDHDHCY